MEHLVVLEVVEQRVRHSGCGAGHVDRGAGNAGCRRRRGLDEHLDRQRLLVHPEDHQRPPARPGRQHGEGNHPDQQREPAADRNFQEVGAEIEQVDGEEDGEQGAGEKLVPFPQREQHHRDQHPVDQHRPGHRNAIGRGEIGRTAEIDHQHQHHDHQRPIDRGDVDLPRGMFAGVGDVEPRDEAQLDRLLGNRESARNHGLAGDDRRHRREQDKRQAQHFRSKEEERVLDRLDRVRGIEREQHRPLPHVIEQQRGHDKEDPRHADRVAPEMPHVRIKRLGAGHRQHHRTHRDEPGDRRGEEELHRIPRVEHLQDDDGIIEDVPHPEHGNHDEVKDHDRAEQQPDLGGAARLDREQPDQDHDRRGNHERSEPGGDGGQALDRR